MPRARVVVYIDPEIESEFSGEVERRNLHPADVLSRAMTEWLDAGAPARFTIVPASAQRIGDDSNGNSNDPIRGGG